MGLFAPTGVPAAISDRLIRCTLDAQSEPAVVRRLSELGFVQEPLGGAAFRDHVARQVAFWSDFVKQANIKPH